ncbi:nucleoside triphosphate pyrophosphohydrolase [Aetokthonos hydrillicola Thurmond2011]|jgi:XTP/dITP diphosphohydrolase|uniref:Nucleoside triphosphate pyrophosphohydrolase n=1 Tax=Aetokthonos hydrillicola Thurmond2011 TaxID=2712845 RepID=A0AAP5I846_9CYAN|nr:nucleoside triphosphate pyrophosphohydrolase [Aetokthonos hydrillicola]MBO3459433.1 nucleoside triphosphate pyrophosphohydrolase [Aetokthonos hydrillicola CCALA 1050]MBW4583796.1 nucleoside triphosphate pyrophosphohydrolase [Aetokthonos hydrillicola CCALA 1050]MDR9895509.1 nucleoside triphosphate pyrophosphohydrolase [Aetokthonos hydrillicola Thurmond2011]
MNTDTLAALQELIDVVAKLRSPDGGCPWDLAQTPQTLTPYVIEEAYEVVDAINNGDKHAIAEELGDLLLQVVLQAQIASEDQEFSLKEVAQGISQKLIRRHPHVFGDVTVESVDDVRQNWEQIKAQEKGEPSPENQTLSQKLIGYTRKLPPLMATMKISQKAAAVGFEWENIDGVWEKFNEELTEFQQALAHETPERQQEELGDVLFSLLQLARWNNLDPSAALQGTNQRFIQRLQKMEAFATRPLSDYSLNELEELWQQAKKHLTNQQQHGSDG